METKGLSQNDESIAERQPQIARGEIKVNGEKE